MLQILLFALAQSMHLDATVISAPRSEPTVTSSSAKRIGSAWGGNLGVLATRIDLHPEDKSDPRINPNGTVGWVAYNFEVWDDFNSAVTRRLGLLNLTDPTYRLHGSGIDAEGRRAVLSVHVRF